jgi:hypothetical protein
LACKKSKWTTYKQKISGELKAGQEPTQPKPTGGRREVSSTDGTKGNHLTEEGSRARQKEMASTREKQQHLDYTKTEFEYRNWIFAPFLILLVPILITYTGLQSLVAVPSKIFDRKCRGPRG